MGEPTDENRSGRGRAERDPGSAAREAVSEPEADVPEPVASGADDVPEPKDRLTWALVWGMGIVGAIVVIVWLGMILFIR